MSRSAVDAGAARTASNSLPGRPLTDEFSVSLALQTIPWTIALGALLASAVTDLRSRIIPNEFVVLVALSGIAISAGLRPGEAWVSFLVAAVVFLALAIACHYRLIGGGDVKLISAAALLFPPDLAGWLLMNIALAGGVLSCLYLAARSVVSKPSTMPLGTGAHASSGLQRWIEAEKLRIADRKSLPYGIAILAGVMISIASEYPRCFSAISS